MHLPVAPSTAVHEHQLEGCSIRALTGSSWPGKRQVLRPIPAIRLEED